jgi:hypothetical protein
MPGRVAPGTEGNEVPGVVGAAARVGKEMVNMKFTHRFRRVALHALEVVTNKDVLAN